MAAAVIGGTLSPLWLLPSPISGVRLDRDLPDTARAQSAGQSCGTLNGEAVGPERW